MAYGLASVATLALIGLGSVDSMQVCPQPDLGGAHLCDERADGSVDSCVCFQDCFSWTDAESVKVSTVLSGIPALTPLLSHRLANGCLRGRRQDLPFRLDL